MSTGEFQQPSPQTLRWRVVGVAFALAVFAWGVGFYGPSILLQALHAAHGWPISTISAAITAHFLLSAAMVAYLPEAHRRFGLVHVTLAGIAASALGTLAWANAQAPWQLFAAAIVSSAGWAATSGAAINAIVSPWFDRDRPKALSMAFNGASIGGVLFPPLWAVLNSRIGLAATAAVVAAAMVAILAPLVAGIVRAPPAGLGGAPDGSLRRPEQRVGPGGLSRRELVRDRRFVRISGAFALGLFAQVGLLAHLMTGLGPILGSDGAAWALSLVAASAVAGRTLLAWLLGSRNRRHAAAVNFLVQATGVVLLVQGGGAVPVLAGCVLLGAGVGNLISLPPLIAQQEFQAGDVARVVALLTAVNQAAFACAPAVFGVLRDLAGDYTAAFAVAACAQVAAACIVASGRP
ncbi:MAG: MFS transporter [Hyphomicrobiaceae bacterium]|nr:MFS transporter [Hyphomicrobiaceae bacterium]